jgi:hypothetical protein
VRHVRAPHVLAKLGLECGFKHWQLSNLIEEQLQCKIREHKGVETQKPERKRSFSLSAQIV